MTKMSFHARQKLQLPDWEDLWLSMFRDFDRTIFWLLLALFLL